MNILVVSSLYPPYYVGGYEIGCKEAVDELLNRGHKVTVLTSTYGGKYRDDNIYRCLSATFGFHPRWKILLRELHNQRTFRYYCNKIKPDIIFFWKLSDISMSLVSIARQKKFLYCFYVFDNWLTELNKDQWFLMMHSSRFSQTSRWGARLLGLNVLSSVLSLSNVIFASNYLKELTLHSYGSINNLKVIPWGIDPNTFCGSFPHAKTSLNRLLYVGQIVKHKGVHVAIEAFAILRNKYHKDISLTIVGDIEQEPRYSDYLKEIINQHDLRESVNFTGKIARDEISQVYKTHDILVFPSLWEEPFGITPLEAMACGLAVVSSGTGGSSETLRDGWNALLYDKHDIESCALQILRLLDDQELYSFIRQNAYHTVRDCLNLKNTIDSIEQFLLELTC